MLIFQVKSRGVFLIWSEESMSGSKKRGFSRKSLDHGEKQGQTIEGCGTPEFHFVHHQHPDI